MKPLLVVSALLMQFVIVHDCSCLACTGRPPVPMSTDDGGC